METLDISIFSLALTFLLLVIPVFISLIYGLKMARPIAHSIFRMSVQLVLIGIFLKYLFRWNNAGLNVLWLIIMILVAVFSAIRNSSIRFRRVFVPAFLSFSISTFFVIFYLNEFVLRLTDVFDARYLIILGGMLLGNCLRGNIIGISSFYKNISKYSKEYLYSLSLGATEREAILPYLRASVGMALRPTLAAMATMGIVALPGMMTGVILGGASPEVAIKYQIMIMVAILTSTVISIVLTILLTFRSCFDKYGILRQDVLIGN